MKPALIEQLGIYLFKQGYTLKYLTRTCFDVLARKDDRILLIKVLEDANAINKDNAEEMARLSSYLDASPLVIAEKAGVLLQDNVVYLRFGLSTLNMSTFCNACDQSFPFIKMTTAGLTAAIDGKKLRQRRESKGFSLKAVARKIGVSTRMISKYEAGSSEVTVQKAMRMYHTLGNVFESINVFKYKTSMGKEAKSDISKQYTHLGFTALETKKSPFDIVAKKEKELIFTEVGDKVNPNALSVSKLVGGDNLVIFKKNKPKHIPSMTKKDFMDFEKAEELVRFLKEY